MLRSILPDHWAKSQKDTKYSRLLANTAEWLIYCLVSWHHTSFLRVCPQIRQAGHTTCSAEPSYTSDLQQQLPTRYGVDILSLTSFMGNRARLYLLLLDTEEFPSTSRPTDQAGTTLLDNETFAEKALRPRFEIMTLSHVTILLKNLYLSTG
jgi:hypothetical protein